MPIVRYDLSYKDSYYARVVVTLRGPVNSNPIAFTGNFKLYNGHLKGKIKQNKKFGANM